ncbi:dihydroorotase family protein [Taklimakanibacter deserti]|uniref:dihydroorotase family protein n=1 Tax=Taklimakanibacter deserti TaxID=2267839 RepID=UPI0034D6C028
MKASNDMAKDFDTLITNATVIDADAQSTGQVGIVGGRIAALLGQDTAATARTVIDASGSILLPGLVDAHAHLREPGLTHKEDFSSGTHAAALGGVTTVLDMPTDDPWTATAEQLSDKMAMAQNRIHVDVGFQAVVSHDLDQILPLHELAPVSFELFTADVPQPFLFATMDAVLQALERFRGLDTLVAISPGDQSLLLGGLERAGTDEIAAFLDSRPASAEANGISRAVLAAATTGIPIHVRQINSSFGVETWGRLRGMADASIETTPQNLFFTAEDYRLQGANVKASPPFRAKADIDALRQAVVHGLIDIIGTDHAPHTPAEKAPEFTAFGDIPGGMPGLQTLLPAMLKLVDEGLIDFADIARLCARNPAERFGLGKSKGRIAVGHDADIVFLDPRQSSVIRNADQVSKAGYTPYDDWTVSARLTRVLLRGEEIVRDGKLVAQQRGQVVTRKGGSEPWDILQARSPLSPARAQG